MTVKIDYDRAKENYMKSDVEAALKIFLNGEPGECFCIVPQALNPFLKAIENIGKWREVMVIPGHGVGTPETSKPYGKPTYIIVKVPTGETVSEVSFV